NLVVDARCQRRTFAESLLFLNILAEVCAMGSGSKQQPGYHNRSWYNNHPEVPRPTLQNQSQLGKEPSPMLLLVIRLLGVGLVFGGIALMEIRFWLGVIVVLVGFAAILLEIC